MLEAGASDRGFGEVEALQGALPEWLLFVFELLTRFGDVAVLAAVTIVVALVLDRDRGLFLFAVVIGGFAVLTGLKAILGFPRPPVEYHLIETATTGFPSGHALGAALVYGAIATSIDAGHRTSRYAAVGAIVAVVSVSRIALGVHYLVDVLVGVAVAIGYLWAVTRYVGGDPGRAIGAAAGLGGVALVVGVAFGPTPQASCAGGLCLDRDTAIVGAVTIGTAAAWYRRRATFESMRVTGGASILGLGAGGTVFAIDAALALLTFGAALGGAVVVEAIEREVLAEWARRNQLSSVRE